jgi:hypothetical protein
MQKLFTAILFCLVTGTVLAQEESADASFDGLQRVEGARVGAAYIDPEADFSVFQRVAILDPHIAFRSNWQRDVNRGRSRNISARDMERIRADMQTVFRDVFTQRLEAAGYQIVNEADYDVLVLRPAIIDLDIAAPDRAQAGRSRTYTATGGAATLYIQLLDSVSGDVIGRAIDRTVARTAGGQVSWTNRVTNLTDARRAMGRWADILVDFLNSHYYKPSTEDVAAAAAAGAADAAADEE